MVDLIPPHHRLKGQPLKKMQKDRLHISIIGGVEWSGLSCCGGTLACPCVLPVCTLRIHVFLLICLGYVCGGKIREDGGTWRRQTYEHAPRGVEEVVGKASQGRKAVGKGMGDLGPNIWYVR